MQNAQRYTLNAHECSRFAARARRPEDRESLRLMALEWLKLAESAAEPIQLRLREPISFRPCEGDRF
jgi:hypothetical protein